MNLIQKRIKHLNEAEGIQLKKLCEKCKTNYPTFQKLRETGSIGAIEKVKTLCHALGLAPEEVLNWNEDDQDYMEAVKVSDRIEAGEEPTFTLDEVAEKLGERELSK